MLGALAYRPLLRLLRFVAALALALSLSGLSHAAEEMVESVVHVAATGHSAHASEHPEGDGHTGAEHFCFGTVHHCGCCSTAFAVTTGATWLPMRTIHRVQHRYVEDDLAHDGVRVRIDRPPRA